VSKSPPESMKEGNCPATKKGGKPSEKKRRMIGGTDFLGGERGCLKRKERTTFKKRERGGSNFGRGKGAATTEPYEGGPSMSL